MYWLDYHYKHTGYNRPPYNNYGHDLATLHFKSTSIQYKTWLYNYNYSYNASPIKDTHSIQSRKIQNTKYVHACTTIVIGEKNYISAPKSLYYNNYGA